MGVKQAIEEPFPHPELGPKAQTSTLPSQIPAAAFKIKGLEVPGGKTSRKEVGPCLRSSDSFSCRCEAGPTRLQMTGLTPTYLMLQLAPTTAF